MSGRRRRATPVGWARREGARAGRRAARLARWAARCGALAAGLGVPSLALAQSELASVLERWIRIPAVSGYESALRDSIRAQLPGSVEAQVDPLGSLVVRIGPGEPEVLFACALDETGYLVSGVTEEGYLRLRRVGRAPHPLYDQFLEGQRVQVYTRRGPVAGVVAVRSIHLQERRGLVEPPFGLEQAFVDVGAESARDVQALGIDVLDPVTRWRVTSRLAHDQVAGLAAQARGSCLALLEAAKRLASAQVGRGVALVWAALERVGRQGIHAVSRAFPEVGQVYWIDGGFGFDRVNRRLRYVGGPAPGVGVLIPAGASWDPPSRIPTARAPHAAPPPAAYTSRPDWAGRVRYVGLPVLYPATPVETVSARDVRALADLLVAAARGGVR